MPDLELSVRAHFRARMAIPDHQGVCRQPHGYRFIVTAYVQVPLPLADTPWTMDLVTIESALEDVIAPLRDGDLTALLGYPSFEAVLLWLVERLSARLPHLQRVELEAPPKYAVAWTAALTAGQDAQNS